MALAVEQAVESNTPTQGTTHTVNLPSAVTGNLLLIILARGSTAASVNAHGSLTELLDEAVSTGIYIAYRQMDGTEPASYTLNTSVSTRMACIAYRISGWDTSVAPEIATTSTGTSATPDPPASATPGSTKEYLFVAFFSSSGESVDDDGWVTASPTNYTPAPPRQKSCGTAGTNLAGMIAAAERLLSTGTAENPGTFTKAGSTAWRGQTVMISPSAGGVTYNTTGAFVSATVLLGADVAEYVEAGALTSAISTIGADVPEHAETGTAATDAVASGVAVKELPSIQKVGAVVIGP